MVEATREDEWSSEKVRSTFLDFFQKKYAHKFVDSSPVVPVDDPTLLFTNAGMNQFKPLFLGQADPNGPLAGLKRACNSQKCIRAGGKHNDLDDVGRVSGIPHNSPAPHAIHTLDPKGMEACHHEIPSAAAAQVFRALLNQEALSLLRHATQDTYHHTFFEMLGNWSFGDYFKEEAITWAFELLTEEYGLKPENMYATYYEGNPSIGLEPDDAAREIWMRFLPPERILPFGAKDNFWEMGEVGPCGPASEIHYDRIGGRDASSKVNMDDPMVIEIWNLVFIQFNREQDGSLRQLPNKHIDTGMGFERLTSILQGKQSNYDTDVFAPIFKAIQEKTECRPYEGKLGEEDKDGIDMAYRVVADHIRTLTFAITDGCVPSNDGRGYVLRRILRRAVRYGQQFLLNGDGEFFASLVAPTVQQFGVAFPELVSMEPRVYEIILEEEQTFGRTLQKGIERFRKKVPIWTEQGVTMIPGEEVFFLYDTMGFPVDLTEIMAKECNLNVDMDGYNKAMANAKAISRTAARSGTTPGGKASKIFVLEAQETDHLEASGIAVTLDQGKYTWYHEPTAVVKAIFNGDTFEESTQGLPEGEQVGVVLDRTSFYAKAGGQVADIGHLKGANGGVDVVVDGCMSFGGYILHMARVQSGELTVGDEVTCSVDYVHREKVAPNHTMTHVLNFALRKVLGGIVDQKGSELDAEKLRFDFSCNKPVSLKDCTEVERICLDVIKAELVVHSLVVSLAAAKAINSLRAVFGETYPDPVRVVAIGKEVEAIVADPENELWSTLSVELCGGTHIGNTKDAHDFALVAESGVAKGIRRMVALTGDVAKASYRRAEELREKLAVAGEVDDKDLAGLVSQLSQEIDVAMISIPKKAELEKVHGALVERMKKAEKAASAAAEAAATEEAMRRAEAAGEAGDAFVVCELPFFADAKIASKLVALMVEKMKGGSAMVVSHDAKKKKVLAVAACSPEHVEKGQLVANQWVAAAVKAAGGKGGGKPNLAQAQAQGDASLTAVISEAARSFAQEALSK